MAWNDPTEGLLSGFNELVKPQTYIEGLQYVAGATASIAFPTIVLPMVKLENKGIPGYIGNLVGAGIASGISGFLFKDRTLARRVLIGGVVATGLRVVYDALGSTFNLQPLAGLGAAQDTLQREIDRAVREELGISDFPVTGAPTSVADFPTVAEQVPLGDYPTYRQRGLRMGVSDFPVRSQQVPLEDMIPVDEAS